MKLIITEEQYRLIIENEDKVEKNLINFTQFMKINPSKWDDMFLHINKKKGGIYDGYYIYEDLILSGNEIKSLNYLIRVKGDLSVFGTEVESMDRLEEVGGDLNILLCKI